MTHQPKHFSNSYPVTITSASIVFNCKKISLFKQHCALREDGTILNTYEEFSEDLLEKFFDTIGNEPAVFQFRFIFITVNNSTDVIAQLFLET